jgi:spore photoproduct lyase
MEKPLIDSFQKIYIDVSAKSSGLARRAREFFPAHKIFEVKERPYGNSKGMLSASEFDRSKRELYITEFKGSFFKRCPGAKPGLACCNYFVLNLGLQCNMNCSYCYLQSYINSPVMTVYSNIEQALFELKAVADEHPDRYYRVGTGETTDSLSLDDFTLYSQKLVTFFRDLPHWTLELKTKSSKVDAFLETPHSKNVIVSWSINPEFIVETEEHGTASLQHRLAAARKCSDKGFKVTFNFDPMIWYPEWKSGYAELVDQIVSQFRPEEIPYITVGALRFVPEQKQMMTERFGPKSWVVQSETFLSSTGKMRYDSHLRAEMFQLIVERFKSHSPKWRVSLCMETPENWVTTMATGPKQIPELSALFDPPQKKPNPLGVTVQ